MLGWSAANSYSNKEDSFQTTTKCGIFRKENVYILQEGVQRGEWTLFVILYTKAIVLHCDTLTLKLTELDYHRSEYLPNTLSMNSMVYLKRLKSDFSAAEEYCRKICFMLGNVG